MSVHSKHELLSLRQLSSEMASSRPADSHRDPTKLTMIGEAMEVNILVIRNVCSTVLVGDPATQRPSQKIHSMHTELNPPREVCLEQQSVEGVTEYAIRRTGLTINNCSAHSLSTGIDSRDRNEEVGIGAPDHYPPQG